MKVKKLIAELQKYDPDIPVCLEDWNEQWMDPREVVSIDSGNFGCSVIVSGQHIQGTFNVVVLGCEEILT